MQTKKSRKPVKPVTVILYIFLIALAVIYVAPLLWMLCVSLKDNAGVMAAPFACRKYFTGKITSRHGQWVSLELHL